MTEPSHNSNVSIKGDLYNSYNNWSLEFTMSLYLFFNIIYRCFNMNQIHIALQEVQVSHENHNFEQKMKLNRSYTYHNKLIDYKPNSFELNFMT